MMNGAGRRLIDDLQALPRESIPQVDVFPRCQIKTLVKRARFAREHGSFDRQVRRIKKSVIRNLTAIERRIVELAGAFLRQKSHERRMPLWRKGFAEYGNCLNRLRLMCGEMSGHPSIQWFDVIASEDYQMAA